MNIAIRIEGDLMNLPTEEQARAMGICPACGVQKDVGLVVCWHCFKRRPDVVPLKWSGMQFQDWLAMVKAASN